MSTFEFRDNDEGYRDWLGAHPDGCVLNIARSHSVGDARVHLSGCWTISGQSPRGSALTGLDVKVCASMASQQLPPQIKTIEVVDRRLGRTVVR